MTSFPERKIWSLQPTAAMPRFKPQRSRPMWSSATLIHWALRQRRSRSSPYAAINYALKQGYETFYLYGCTGGRVDHTIANIQTAADLAAQGKHCLIFSKAQIITAIASETVTFSEQSEGFLSVFAHCDTCKGVCLKGLKYELDDAELTNRFPLGVSNEFIGQKATVTIRSGVAILIYDRKNLMAH